MQNRHDIRGRVEAALPAGRRCTITLIGLGAGLLLLMLGAPVARAATVAESGDAGSLPATAQQVIGATAIAGTFRVDGQDADMYALCLSGGATFSASTASANGGSTAFDSQLFLFDSAGRAVYSNDDDDSVVRSSTLPAGHALTPAAGGTYYLAISRYNNEPVDANGFKTFIEADFFAINGAATTNPIAAWDNATGPSVSDGSYTIALTGTCPATMLLTGFFAPVDSDQVNTAKAGQTVAVKWRLTDLNGVPISDPATFVSVTSQPTGGACAGQPSDAIEIYSGGSGLQYLGDGNWQFNWRTPKAYANQCRTMTLTLSDGTTRQALFQFS